LAARPPNSSARFMPRRESGACGSHQAIENQAGRSIAAVGSAGVTCTRVAAAAEHDVTVAEHLDAIACAGRIVRSYPDSDRNSDLRARRLSANTDRTANPLTKSPTCKKGDGPLALPVPIDRHVSVWLPSSHAPPVQVL
jgi:hypothetical protein